jgi:putative oxidoreductase
MKTAFLLGRLVFGGFFIYSGVHHFQEKKKMAQYAGAKNVPVPEIAVMGTGTAMIAGGASVLLGVKPKVGALLLVAVLAGISPMMHNFWEAQDPAQKQNDMINFMKNMAMLGAALALMGVEEPWPASVPLGQPSTIDRVRRIVRQVAA